MMTRTYTCIILLIFLVSCINKPIPKRFEGKYNAYSTNYSYGPVPECCVQNATCECWDTVIKRDTFEVEIKEQEYEDAENIISIGAYSFAFSDVNKGEYHYYRLFSLLLYARPTYKKWRGIYKR